MVYAQAVIIQLEEPRFVGLFATRWSNSGPQNKKSPFATTHRGNEVLSLCSYRVSRLATYSLHPLETATHGLVADRATPPCIAEILILMRVTPSPPLYILCHTYKYAVYHIHGGVFVYAPSTEIPTVSFRHTCPNLDTMLKTQVPFAVPAIYSGTTATGGVRGLSPRPPCRRCRLRFCCAL